MLMLELKACHIGGREELSPLCQNPVGAVMLMNHHRSLCTLKYFVSPSCGLRLLVLYSTLVGFVTLYSGLPSCKKNITYKMGQFRYFKIQLQTMDVNMRLWCINPTNTAVYSPESRAGVYCLQVSLNHRNWPIDLSWF